MSARRRWERKREKERGGGLMRRITGGRKERTGGTKPRGRYASETCRNAKRCRPGSGDDRASGKGSARRHLRRPRNRRSARASPSSSRSSTITAAHNYRSRIILNCARVAVRSFLSNLQTPRNCRREKAESVRDPSFRFFTRVRFDAPLSDRHYREIEFSLSLSSRKK